ncbi:alpha/beta hydrolase [Sulfurimonas sp. HSL-3221]|uniref:alpha/beta fold hydrolase n=1 Tax=Sulfurimonadaceae TaxID=2771471 RepID=UPI001E61AE09|nr:alpha/beta hydrolase [Sulfurimonas sp. HSL-3221]UFS63381.1 alpha/beta hydrolase [Sulfurimonas sp. HSL-3221]
MAIKTLQYAQQTFSISYEIVNPGAKHTIVFLHGWGSNKELMKQAFGRTLDTFRHVYIDLPGFGNSTAPIALDSEGYADIMELFLAQINANDKEVIVGHSFGGKVATLLRPRLLVLLSSAGIVWPKPLKVRAKIAAFKLLKNLGLAQLRARFVAEDAKSLNRVMYETFKRVVNEDFSGTFRHFGGRALLCWGRDDTATPMKSAEKIDTLIENSRLVAMEGDHYFFLKQPEAVAAEIAAEFTRSVK